MRRELVVIGTSWGGLAALQSLLPGVPGDLAAPVVVAQHRSPGSRSRAMVDLVQAHTTLRVCEADDKNPLVPGHVYLAPPDYHLLVQQGTLHLSVEERVRHSRPSIDMLFETAADAYGERTVGIVLTGANSDGALGLRAIQEHGGYTIVQDPEQAERSEMPAAALGWIEPDTVALLEEIGPLLGELCGTKTAGVA